MGKLAYEAVSSRKTYFSEEDVRGCPETASRQKRSFSCYWFSAFETPSQFPLCVEPGHAGTFVFTCPPCRNTWLPSVRAGLGRRLHSLGGQRKWLSSWAVSGEDVNLVLGIMAKAAALAGPAAALQPAQGNSPRTLAAVPICLLFTPCSSPRRNLFSLHNCESPFLALFSDLGSQV